MRRRWARHRVIPVVGIAVVATTAVTILEVAPWASGATQFRHTASSPAFQRGSDQGLAVTVTNMASRAQECVVVIRGADGSKLNTLRVSIPAGHAQVEGFLAGDFSQFTNRVVVQPVCPARRDHQPQQREPRGRGHRELRREEHRRLIADSASLGVGVVCRGAPNDDTMGAWRSLRHCA
jgi:hypothetical protein